MEHLWLGIKASPEGREGTVDGRLFWSLCLETFYSLCTGDWEEEEVTRGCEGIHEVR